MKIEPLESRQFLSGNVKVAIIDGILNIKGDYRSNMIYLTSTSDNHVSISVSKNNQINRGESSIKISEPFRELLINLGDGDDQVSISNLRYVGNILINGENGKDTISIRSSRLIGNCTIQAGNDNDQISIRKTVLNGKSIISGNAGDDSFSLSSVTSRRAVALVDTLGLSRIAIAKTTYNSQSSIVTGGQDDQVIIDQSVFARKLTLSTSDGDDSIFVRGTLFNESSPFDAGLGNNDVDREVILNTDFANGSQGWVSGFSDYGGSQSIADTVNAQQSAEMSFPALSASTGIKQLPTELGSNSSGLKTQFSNYSADTFAYIKKGLTIEDGIIASRDYRLSFDIQFASNVPNGLGGIGSSPSAVFLKTGGASIEPRVVYNTTTKYVGFNLNKGNQANGGSDLSVAGTIANDNPAQFGLGFKSVQLTHDHPSTVKSSNSGQMWVTTGFETGFEGTTQYYYKVIAVKITPI